MEVDLDDFDLEIVWFWRPHATVVALSLRDYTAVGAISFAKGLGLPPDISPPYLQGQVLSEIIRLRPSTAQLLLHMADLQDGDVVVDPCVGIGTVVLECLHMRQPSCLVAMGGDLELKDTLRTTAADYAQQTRQWLAATAPPQEGRRPTTSTTVASLFAWDATALPLSQASVDAIVSDLPFGRSCLSANRLNELLPLMLAEFSRVLRPSTGRLVLLCGNHQVLLEGLQQANQKAMASVAQHCDHHDATAVLCWELPVSTCRPVNIGGQLAWILCVRRGPRLVDRIGRTSALLRYHVRQDHQNGCASHKPQR